MDKPTPTKFEVKLPRSFLWFIALTMLATCGEPDILDGVVHQLTQDRCQGEK